MSGAQQGDSVDFLATAVAGPGTEVANSLDALAAGRPILQVGAAHFCPLQANFHWWRVLLCCGSMLSPSR